jgi:predicted HicB family RNase H-like nuclease
MQGDIASDVDGGRLRLMRKARAEETDKSRKAAKASGKPAKKESTHAGLKFYGVWLPPELHRRAKARAALREENVSGLVARALRALLEAEIEPGGHG